MTQRKPRRKVIKTGISHQPQAVGSTITPGQIQAGLLSACTARRGINAAQRAIVEGMLDRYWLPPAKQNKTLEELTAGDVSKLTAPWWLGMAAAVREPRRFRWHLVKQAGPAAKNVFAEHWCSVTGISMADYGQGKAA